MTRCSRCLLVLAITIGLVAGSLSGDRDDGRPSAAGWHRCSTFLLESDDALIVGHNLDEYFDVAGAVVVNKRGVQKESISWEEDLYTVFGRSRTAQRATWTSKYGSITYNTQGKEFADGGMNEAGLYVGEMSLTRTATVLPEGNDRPRIYPQLWIQYQLDNFATVDEVIAGLDDVYPGGPSTWHFFIADRHGETAGVEFLDGSPTVYLGDTMPFRVMTNPSYASELAKLRGFKGFGGDEEVDLANKTVDNRTVWASAMLAAYPAAGRDPVAYAFDILEQLEMGNNQWNIAYDITQGRMHFRTATAHRLRWVDLSAFDFSCAAPAEMLDINEDLEGDVSARFSPYTKERNREFIRQALAPYDLGVPKPLANAFKLLWARRLHSAARSFTCVQQS